MGIDFEGRKTDGRQIYSFVEVEILKKEASCLSDITEKSKKRKAAIEVVVRFLMRPTQENGRKRDPRKHGDAVVVIDAKMDLIRGCLPELERNEFKETGTNTDYFLGQLVWLFDAAREERVAFDRLKPLVRDLLHLKKPTKDRPGFCRRLFRWKNYSAEPYAPKNSNQTRRDAQAFFAAAILIKNGFSDNAAFTIVADAFAKCGVMFAQYSKENQGKNLPGNIRSCYEKGKRKYGDEFIRLEPPNQTNII